MKLILTASVFVTALGLHLVAIGHGFLENSRVDLCSQGINLDCGDAADSSDDIVGVGRFSQSGAADGTIAAAGNNRFAALNQQSTVRWNKIDMQPGNNTFKWTATIAHNTRDWRYFITKSGWNPNAPLARASFDLFPFCSVAGNNQSSGSSSTHNCMVPARNGYHVILSLWDINSVTYYSAMDVSFPQAVNGVISELLLDD